MSREDDMKLTKTQLLDLLGELRAAEEDAWKMWADACMSVASQGQLIEQLGARIKILVQGDPAMSRSQDLTCSCGTPMEFTYREMSGQQIPVKYACPNCGKTPMDLLEVMDARRELRADVLTQTHGAFGMEVEDRARP